MSGRIHYHRCPVCNSTAINPLLTLKDHSVSEEKFVVWHCNDCSLRFTQDVPDADSIQPYYRSDAYISHTNTSRGFINSTYQRVRKFTLKEKARLIRKCTGKPTGRLLDVGAGTGAFLQQMKKNGWEVTGIEPDEGARNTARTAFGVVLETPALLQELPAASFDAITLWHVLEHVHDLQATIAQLKTLLKASGRLFIAVPNYQSLDAGIYRLNWAAYDVPRHLYHFSPQAMETLMSRNGLQVIAKKPMWFDAFYISLLSSKYRNGKSNMLGSLINGIRSNINAALHTNQCSSIIYINSKA